MQSITVHELHAAAGVVVDVREDVEFAGGRVPGALSLPMSTLGARLDELPDGPFAVICAAGVRSARVVEALEARGYDATNVEGGTDAWIAAGYDVER